MSSSQQQWPWHGELTAGELSKESLDTLLGIRKESYTRPIPTMIALSPEDAERFNRLKTPIISDSLADLGKKTALLLSSAAPSIRHIIQSARDRELAAAMDEREGGFYVQPDFSKMMLLNEQGSSALKTMIQRYEPAQDFNEASVHVTPRGLTGKEASKRKSRNKLSKASKKRNR